MTYSNSLLLLLLLWLLFNWLAPATVMMYGAERLSLGRLPADLLRRTEAKRVRFYLGTCRRSYGYSVWVWPYTVVIFDRRFFTAASGDLVRFVVAHELGHVIHRDHVQRWWAVVTGVALLPIIKRRFEEQEQSADRYAIALTGLQRSQFPGL